MKNDKKRLFEAFEKICKVKLIKESFVGLSEVEDYILNKLVIRLDDLEEGENDIDLHEFEFKVNNEDFYGTISMIVDVECENEPESEFAPGYSECNITKTRIYKLELFDNFNSIAKYEYPNEFLSKLERTKTIEMYP